MKLDTKILFCVLVFVLFLVFLQPVKASSEIKTISYFGGFYEEMEKNTEYTSIIDFNPPDGVQDIYFLRANVVADINSANILITTKINGMNCVPSEYYTKALGRNEISFECSGYVNKSDKYNFSINTGKKISNVFITLDIVYENNPEIEIENIYNNIQYDIQAFGTEYKYGDRAKAWIQVLDISNLPVENLTCIFYAYSPDDTIFINQGTMPELGDGIYYYDFIAPLIQGTYPMVSKCYIAEETQIDETADGFILEEGALDSGDYTDTWTSDNVKHSLVAYSGDTGYVNAVYNFTDMCEPSESEMSGLNIFWEGEWRRADYNAEIWIYNWTSSSYELLPNYIVPTSVDITVSNALTGFNNSTTAGYVSGGNLKIKINNTDFENRAFLRTDQLQVSCLKLNPTNVSWELVRGGSEMHLSDNGKMYSTKLGSVEQKYDTGLFMGSLHRNFTVSSATFINTTDKVIIEGIYDSPCMSVLNLTYFNESGNQIVDYVTDWNDETKKCEISFDWVLEKNGVYNFELQETNFIRGRRLENGANIALMDEVMGGLCTFYEVQRNFTGMTMPMENPPNYNDSFENICNYWNCMMYFYNSTGTLLDNYTITDDESLTEYQSLYNSHHVFIQCLEDTWNTMSNALEVLYGVDYSDRALWQMLGVNTNMTETWKNSTLLYKIYYEDGFNTQNIWDMLHKIRNSPVDTDKELVISLPFNYVDSKGFTPDVSGINNDGYLNGFDTGYFGNFYGNALEFNKTNYVSIPDENVLDIENEITISVWVKMEIGSNPDLGTNNALVLNKDNTFNSGLSYDRQGNKMYFQDESHSVYTDTSIDLEDGNWHYYVGVYNGTHGLIYLDGNLNDTESAFDSGGWNNSYDVKIGGGVTGRYLNGTIDNVKVWNRALTENEIEYEYLSSGEQYGYLGTVDLTALETLISSEHDSTRENITVEAGGIRQNITQEIHNSENNIISSLNSTMYSIRDYLLSEMNSSIWMAYNSLSTTINAMNNLSASEVWEYSPRTLTDYNQSEMWDYLWNINDSIGSMEINNTEVLLAINQSEINIKNKVEDSEDDVIGQLTDELEDLEQNITVQLTSINNSMSIEFSNLGNNMTLEINDAESNILDAIQNSCNITGNITSNITAVCNPKEIWKFFYANPLKSDTESTMTGGIIQNGSVIGGWLTILAFLTTIIVAGVYEWKKH